MLVMAKLEVVALVPVAFANTKLPVSVVDDRVAPVAVRPPLNAIEVVVALEGNGYPIALVTVTAPAEPESEMPEPAVRLVTKLVEVAIW